jgi:hypothetical protein
VASHRKKVAEVFLNVPYAQKFERLFLAYIAGISAFGLVPRVTLEIPLSTRRLEKIIDLITICRYSIHDLSWVKTDPPPPRTPRFNMPFELGLAVADQHNAKSSGHDWFVCEARQYRLAKSLSDLNGTDPFIHDGKIVGVFRELCNIFTRSGRRPSTQQMHQIYRGLRAHLPVIMQRSAATSLYTSRVFKDLTVVASDYANALVV